MKNDKILPVLFSVIPMEQIESVTWYGNRKGKDTDLFVVLKDNDDKYGGFFYEQLDIAFLSRSLVSPLIENLDPLITEPLLTGEGIFGSIDQDRESLLATRVHNKVPMYLLKRAETFYEWATSAAYDGRFPNALNILNFVYSYSLYAFRYWGGNDVVLFKDILSSKDGLWIREFRYKYKNSKHIHESEVLKAFTDTRKMLTDLRLIVGL
ncbi:MAG: hypothetical protein WC229_02440 [Candidatus Paceibacterota bacterium]|jgi:hypothetical protein